MQGSSEAVEESQVLHVYPLWKVDFSNKLMLNQHGYEEGCDEAVYPNGTMTLLLPYPDFLLGQGKMVESIGKTQSGAKGKTKKDTYEPAGEERAPASDDDDFKGSAPSKKWEANVSKGENAGSRGKVPPCADILFGPAQPWSEKGGPKSLRVKGLPLKAKEGARDNGIPIQGRSSPLKVGLQLGGTSRGLLKLAMGATK